MLLQTISVLSVTVVLFGSLEGKGVQMQRDVQCCMQYSQGKVRTKDVLKFEVQTEGPDCSIRAIMQVFQASWSNHIHENYAILNLPGIAILTGRVFITEPRNCEASAAQECTQAGWTIPKLFPERASISGADLNHTQLRDQYALCLI
uniref:Chemokine (C-C motif) ligand 44 n=1 Tax=Pygocentrus nattereri TaxID=42514 RepID=A0AAR2KAI8_PYGNA